MSEADLKSGSTVEPNQNENCDNSTLPVSDSCFVVDRTCIPTVSQDEQEEELCDLNIEVYKQEILEKEILDQVDKALESKALEKASKEKNNSKNDRDYSDGKETFNYLESEETEKERRIRMGEMTPFGTLMPLKTCEENNIENIEAYLKSQIEMEKKRKAVKRKITSKSSKKEESKKTSQPILKRKVLFPKKKKKKEILGTFSSTAENDLEKDCGKLLSEITSFSSGSEYIPTESDSDDSDKDISDSINLSKNKSKSNKKKTTSQISSEDSENEKSVKKKCKGKKEADDGNEMYYLQRLEEWEKSNPNFDLELKTIDDNFKMPSFVWKKLYNYQKVGVQWLWELNIQRNGGILGDEMGLGKTIQVIAFLIGLSVSKLLSKHGSFRGLGPVLIICPTTVMHQWVRELHQWWPQFRVALLHESGTHNGKKSSLIREIVKGNGILITSYITCVQQSDDLLRYTWHYVILDEGHKIRNPDSQITRTTKLLRTPHRIVLTGSPMQNNLKELWSLFDFIFPGKLGTLPVFLAEFSVPITQGGYANASKIQVATAYKCATVLRDTISPYLLRRVKEDVKNHINLPPKNEQVLFCKLTEEQKELYVSYLNSGKVDDILSGKYKIFVGLIDLRKICNHPHLYTGGPKLFKWDDPDSIPEEDRFGYWKKAGKLIVVETLLKMWKKQGHRVLIFTQSRQMLQILEYFVKSQNYEYIKIDGTTNIASRQPLINKFNEDKKYYIFLSTTHVGGLGINLTGANRVVIYDPDWNPATDIQARERAWRIGQENQVTIYRLVTSGTIEEKIYHRQIFKQFLANKVLKDPNQRRFFKSNDLYELFTYKDLDNSTETSSIFAKANVEVNLKSLSHREKLKKIKSKMHLEADCVRENLDAQQILTKKKIEKMKALAQNLSKKISLEISGKVDISDKSQLCEKANNNEQDKSSDINKPLNSYSENVSKPVGNNCVYKYSDRKKKHKKSRRHKKRDAMLDGEVVPNLQKQLSYRELVKDLNHDEADDDYILKKLLSKTGVQTALKHDQIMESGQADFAIIEVEAEKVAQEAVKALKESRKYYNRTFESPVDTSSVQPRFGRKNLNKKPVLVRNENHNDKNVPMSSSELLQRIRQRNGLCPTVSNLSDNPLNEHSELLTDIRNFISFGCETENSASTQKIIDNFRNRLPTSQTPIFKALLNEICNFHRNSSGEGIWELKSEFRW